MTLSAGSNELKETTRPERSPFVRAVEVDGQVFLASPERKSPIALNATGKAIWELCDGRRRLGDIRRELQRRYRCTDGSLSRDLKATLLALEELKVLQLLREGPVVKLAVGIEDKTYFHWQLPILLESLMGKLPPGWEVWVVVCNDREEISAELRQVFETYETRHYEAANHPVNQDMDFASGGDIYVPLNRIEALNTVAPHLRDGEMVYLLETDIFLYGDLNVNIFPEGNALCTNWIIDKRPFFSSSPGTNGVDLDKLLEAFGCPTPFKGGGVGLFLLGSTVKNSKFIRDCFRFTQILYLAGKILDVPKTWIAEMPSFALALTANGIEYELLEHPEFLPPGNKERSIPQGTFYHYHHDPNDGAGGAFPETKWSKQQFYTTNFLKSDVHSFYDKAVTDHERYFFEMARRAQRRLETVPMPQRLEERTREQLARVPYFGLGFATARLEPGIFDRILEQFERHAHECYPEEGNEYLRSISDRCPPALFYEDREFNLNLGKQLKPLHEQWCGMQLVPATCYGIRIYQRGSYLYDHLDRMDTHVISSSVCVAHRLEAPWPFVIEDVNGHTHEISLSPGEIIFYESARLKHGRPFPLRGDYYAACFLHYTPMEWHPSEG